jgi:hypothetical protein
MTKTEKLSLPQWEATDYFQREDFNTAFQALDEGYALAVGSASKAWEASAGKADAETVTALQAVVDTKADAAETEAAVAAAQAQSAADLEALATRHDAALALRGNCQIELGTYVGKGTTGMSNKNTLTFERLPVALFLAAGSTYTYILVRGKTLSRCGSNPLTVTWGTDSVSWYGNSAETQCNESGTTYYYIALFNMAE